VTRPHIVTRDSLCEQQVAKPRHMHETGMMLQTLELTKRMVESNRAHALS
jgi:hypothetical protein